MTYPTPRRRCGALAAALVAVGTLAAVQATAADDPLQIAQLGRAEAAAGSSHGLTPTEALVARIARDLRREARDELRARLGADLSASLAEATVIAD